MWFGHRGLETARPKVDAGMQIFRGDQSKQCACARPLEYRDRTSSNPSGIFSHRSGISTTFVSCARRGGRCACFWTAPGDHMRRPPRKGRTAIAEGCHAHLRQRAGSSCYGAPTATSRPLPERVSRPRSTFPCRWRRPCCVIAPSWRPSTRALKHGHGIPLDLRRVGPGQGTGPEL